MLVVIRSFFVEYLEKETRARRKDKKMWRWWLIRMIVTPRKFNAFGTCSADVFAKSANLPFCVILVYGWCYYYYFIYTQYVFYPACVSNAIVFFSCISELSIVHFFMLNQAKMSGVRSCRDGGGGVDDGVTLLMKHNWK